MGVTAAVCLGLGTGLCIGTQRYLGGAPKTLQGLLSTMKGTKRPCGQTRRRLKVLDLHSTSIELKNILKPVRRRKTSADTPAALQRALSFSQDILKGTPWAVVQGYQQEFIDNRR